MNSEEILDRISRGRTDLVFELLQLDNHLDLLAQGRIKPMQWFVYYNDVTAMKAVVRQTGKLGPVDVDAELGNAAFFGHWKVCDYLILQGANVNSTVTETGETPLHSALAKAGRPYYRRVVRLLLEHGADVNARTIPGKDTGAFMRDVRTRGETPLHRAAAYADTDTIKLLLEHGADKEARDAHGASPMTWASEHLRPGAVLALLAFGEHRLGPSAISRITSDHGAGWGNGMEWSLQGDYLLESR